VCEANFPKTFWEPLWVPKRLREIHLELRAKSLKPKIDNMTQLVFLVSAADVIWMASFWVRAPVPDNNFIPMFSKNTLHSTSGY
jgi:hypothetical protein